MPATVIYEYIIISESVFVELVRRTHTVYTLTEHTESAEHINAAVC